MAGDRRATSRQPHLAPGHREGRSRPIAIRGVAIAGAAGPAMDMVKLFQLQLEHYEKVEASALSLDGKANQLSTMVRNHLPAAMQGLVVVPLFAGYDLAPRLGPPLPVRRDRRALRGEQLRRPPARAACTPARSIKLGFRDGLSRDETLDLAINALFTAADDDSATGGPDLVRGIYPTVATITSDGFERVTEDEVAERFGALIDALGRARVAEPGARGRDDIRPRGAAAMSMPFYVAPEQVMKDRADYARKGIARGRALAAAVYDDGIVICAENPSSTLAQDQRDLRPHRLRRGRQVQRVRPAPHRRRAGRRPQGLRLQPRGRRRPQPGQPVRLRSSARSSPTR